MLRMMPRLAWRAWFTPPPVGGRTAAQDVKATAGLKTVNPAGYAGFEIGEGPLVLALHGWGGRAAQMAPVSRRLAAAGFRVVAVNLPGHGGGEPTDVKQAAAALSAVVDELGEPEALISHSFANVVMRVAGLTAPVVVLVAPLMRVSHAVEVFADRLGLFPWVRRSLHRRLQAWDPELWSVIDGLDPRQHPGARLLVIHDPDDPSTPFAASAELAARRPGTEIVAMSDAGHGGILSEDDTLERVTAFLAESAEEDRGNGPSGTRTFGAPPTPQAGAPSPNFVGGQ